MSSTIDFPANSLPVSDFGKSAETKKDATGTGKLADQEVFLKLLVAQMSHQNPLNPADGIEYVSQLAQFTELEQMMGAKSELTEIRKLLEQQASTDVAGNPFSPNPEEKTKQA